MTSKWMWFCTLFFFVMASTAAPAFGMTLAVGDASGSAGESVEVPIVVDVPTAISGAAFTLNYSSSLTVTVDSAFFDTFYNQFDPLDTTGPAIIDGSGWTFPRLDQNGNPVTDAGNNPVYLPDWAEVGGFTYSQPLIDNVAPQAETVSHYIAGARCTPAAADEDPTLFLLNVSLKSGEPAGVYSIEITPSTIANTEAGYDAAGEAVHLLVGSDTAQPVGSPGAFPVILGADGYAASVIAGRVEFVEDTDGDGLGDNWETEYFTDLSHDGTADSDSDGYTDYFEYVNGTDPTDGSTDPTLSGYTACTDDRMAGTLQSVQLAAVGAAMPGGQVTVTATYGVTGGPSTTGIDIDIYFDSSKVVYTGYQTETFLTAGASIQPPDVANVSADSTDGDNNTATDRLVQMGWHSPAGDWPRERLPVLLAALRFDVAETAQPGDRLTFNVVDTRHADGYGFCGKGTTAEVIDWHLDIDGNGEVDALTDGILVMRYLLGFNLGTPGWTENFRDPAAPKSEADIEAYLGDSQAALDIDGNGKVDALTDGILVMRYLLGFHMAGPGWTADLRDPAATKDETMIEAGIRSLIR